LAAWWDECQDKEVGVSELFPLASALDLGEEGEHSEKTRLGKFLGSMRDRHFTLAASKNGKDRPKKVHLVDAGTHQGAQQWQLLLVDAPPVAG
jgi:hypothetical protein